MPLKNRRDLKSIIFMYFGWINKIIRQHQPRVCQNHKKYLVELIKYFQTQNCVIPKEYFLYLTKILLGQQKNVGFKYKNSCCIMKKGITCENMFFSMKSILDPTIYT